MAPNYSFFCLLFSNGAQPRKPRLPLWECFGSGLQRAHFLHKHHQPSPRAPAGPLPPPVYPQGVTGTHPAPSAPLHCLVSCHGPRWKNSLPRSLLPRALCSSREESPQLRGAWRNGSAEPNQQLHSRLLLGTRDKSRRKGSDPSLGSSLSSKSHSTGIS